MQQQKLQLLSTAVSLRQQVYEVWVLKAEGAQPEFKYWADSSGQKN